MPISATDFLRSIDERLRTLEAERERLLALRLLYVSADSPPAPTASNSTTTGESFPPVPDDERVRLVPDASGRRGLTELILQVAKKHPGLTQAALVRRTQDYVHPDTPLSRGSIRSQLRYMTETGRLTRDNDSRVRIAQDEEATGGEEESLGI